MLSLAAAGRRNTIVIQQCCLCLDYQAVVEELVYNDFYKRFCWFFSISEFETEIESYIEVDCTALTLVYVVSNRPRLETGFEASASDDASDNTSVDFAIAGSAACFAIHLDYAIRYGLERHPVGPVGAATIMNIIKLVRLVRLWIVDRMFLAIYYNRAFGFGIIDLQEPDQYSIAGSPGQDRLRSHRRYSSIHCPQSYYHLQQVDQNYNRYRKIHLEAPYSCQLVKAQLY